MACDDAPSRPFGGERATGEDSGVTLTAAPETQDLLPAVTSLRDEVGTTSLPFDLPGVRAAERGRSELLRQLDDYILPRLTSLDAPLLAVVGGSTGAGKSTLVNSVVGAVVTAPGVLRPTTRSPVLVHHPDDARVVLPGHASSRTSRGPPAALAVEGQAPCSWSPRRALPPGLALLDAPDIDSVVPATASWPASCSRAADLWLFVTTAARYADAVPWHLLRQASERGTSVAVVLDRVAHGLDPRHPSAPRRRCCGAGPRRAPIFTVPESPLEVDGLLPARRDGPAALVALGAGRGRAGPRRRRPPDARPARSTRSTSAPRPCVDAVGGRGQRRRRRSLKAALTAYASATSGVETGMSDGSSLRGEVLARWQEFVGTGEFFRQVEIDGLAGPRPHRGRPQGRAGAVRHLDEALHSGVEELIRTAGQRAATTTSRPGASWPAGQLLQAHPGLARSRRERDRTVSALVRDWQGDILEMVRGEGKDRRTTARIIAYGVNAVGGRAHARHLRRHGRVTGAEIGIAGGTAVVGQKLLEAVFGDQAVRELARQAREACWPGSEALYAAERERVRGAVLDEVHVDAEKARTLARRRGRRAGRP